MDTLKRMEQVLIASHFPVEDEENKSALRLLGMEPASGSPARDRPGLSREAWLLSWTIRPF